MADHVGPQPLDVQVERRVPDREHEQPVVRVFVEGHLGARDVAVPRTVGIQRTDQRIERQGPRRRVDELGREHELELAPVDSHRAGYRPALGVDAGDLSDAHSAVLAGELQGLALPLLAQELERGVQSVARDQVARSPELVVEVDRELDALAAHVELLADAGRALEGDALSGELRRGRGFCGHAGVAPRDGLEREHHRTVLGSSGAQGRREAQAVRPERGLPSETEGAHLLAFQARLGRGQSGQIGHHRPTRYGQRIRFGGDGGSLEREGEAGGEQHGPRGVREGGSTRRAEGRAVARHIPRGTLETPGNALARPALAPPG